MKKYLPFVIVGAVGIVTLTSGTMLYRAKRPPVLRLTGEGRTGSKPGESVHIRGPIDAPVTLEEYGDFQCPPCGMLAGPLKKFEQEYEPHLRVIFHHFPLVTHEHARDAACAAEAAGLQGKFWEMHDLLYREQAQWSKAPDVQALFSAFAGILGLNVQQFRQDMISEKVKDRVAADQKHGASLGVQNTPTIFLNNQAVEPASLNPAKLHEVIDAAVKSKTASTASSQNKGSSK